MASEISAIIPTTLRPSVREAIRSVKEQNGVSVEVVVVVDRDSPAVTGEEMRLVEGADRVLFTGGRMGGGYARNLGVRKCTGSVVGFLDDDDEWLPNKSALQLPRLRTASGLNNELVVGSRVIERSPTTLQTSAPVPDRLIGADEKIEDYLFLRRVPKLGRASFFTSTLLMSNQLAVKIPWDESLRRHQDWDLLSRLGDAGINFVQVPEVTTVYALGSGGSISARPDWRSSLAWAHRRGDRWDRQTFVDFVAGQPLRYALQARSPSGVKLCLSAIRKASRFPSAGPAGLALSGIVPRRTQERVAMIMSHKNRRPT